MAVAKKIRARQERRARRKCIKDKKLDKDCNPKQYPDDEVEKAIDEGDDGTAEFDLDDKSKLGK